MGESPALGREANAQPRNDNAHQGLPGGRSYQQYVNTVPCGGPAFNQVSGTTLKKISEGDFPVLEDRDGLRQPLLEQDVEKLVSGLGWLFEGGALLG